MSQMEPIDEASENSSVAASDHFFLDALKLRKNTASLEQIAYDLERSVPVRDNRFRSKVYKNTFVGSECVDFLVRAKFADSRAGAVDLGRQIASELNSFEHVCLDHELRDDFYFYRFVEEGRRTNSRSDSQDEAKMQADQVLLEIADNLRGGIDVHDRTFRLKTYKKCFVASEAVSYMVQEGLANTRDEAVELGGRLEKELNLWHHVKNDHKFSDAYYFFRFRTEGGSAASSMDWSDLASSSSISVSVSEIPRKELFSIADQLRRGVRVKSRIYRLKTYKTCFVASEAVTFMVKQNIASSREEAIDLGRRLARELHLWYHVTNDHQFSDSYLFFRFSSDSDLSVSSNDQRRERLTSSSTNSDNMSVFSEASLSDIATKLRRGILAKDRIYQLKKFKACFVGSEAVDFMVQARIASSREEAVELGQRLANDFDLFYHVKRQHPFNDGFLFYRFSSSSADDSSYSTDDTFNQDMSEMSDTGFVQSLSPASLSLIGDQLRKGVRIKNHSYRLKTYRNCFIGSEAVDYLVQSRIADSREMAAEICRRLSAGLNLFYHVTYEHQFEDNHLFYRFATVDGSISTASEWSSSSMDVMPSSLGPPIHQKHLSFERNTSLRKREHSRLNELRNGISDCLQVVLVGGPWGCGKSTLVQSTFLTGDDSTLYGTARFDKRKQVAPFATLRLLFSDLCKRLRLSGHVEECREGLVLEFAESRLQQCALAAWIPEMQTIFSDSKDDDSSHLKRKCENMNVIKLALQSFLRAVSSVVPIVLCLDDIMWSDSNTLDILQFLLNRNLKRILFCATYRDDEVDGSHPLTYWRLEVAEEVELETILLENLTTSEIQDSLSTFLSTEPEEVEAFAELLKDRTLGNMFFLIQILDSLQNLSLLVYDYAHMRWTFSVDEIRRMTTVSDNVGVLLSHRIGQLPRGVQQALKLASCFGASFDPEILETTKAVLYIFDDLDVCLQEACKEELLIRVSDQEYIFAHDQVHSVAYHLLPTGDERKMIHWDIGHRLSRKQSKMQNDVTLFACVDQMMLSEDAMFRLIKTEDRPKAATIFLVAGEKAAELSAFVPAAAYLEKGIELLGGKVLGGKVDKAFVEHYDVAVNLFLTYAKTELSAGNISKSRQAAHSVLAYARTDEDKRSANLTIFRCLSAENKLDEQVDFGLRLLEALGKKVPKSPNFVQITLEYEGMRNALKKYSDEEILSLPEMTDKNIEFSIEILCDLVLSEQKLGRVTFVCFALARLVQLTLKHGLCKFTPYIFVLVGQDIIASFNDLKEGQRFLQVGLRCQNIVEAEERGRLLTQSCMALGCVEPITKCMYLGLNAYKASMEVGDIHNAFHGACVYLWSFYFSGLPFKPLLEDVEKFALQML
jgi:predicted ATPase